MKEKKLMKMDQHILKKLFGEKYGTVLLNKYLAGKRTFDLTQILVFATMKGGAGKTSGSTNVAVVLSLLGYKVLFVDSDPQANGSKCFGYNKSSYEGYTLSDALVNKCTAKELVNEHLITYDYRSEDRPVCTIDVIYSDNELKNVAEILVADQSHRDDEYFKNIIGSLESEYDFIIYDTNPTINVLVRNALNHGNNVLIPAQLENFAIEGYGSLLKEISSTDNAPRVLGLFPIQKKNWSLHNQYLEYLNEDDYFSSLMFNSVIKDNAPVAEAQAFGSNVVTYNSKSISAQAFAELTLEIIDRLEVK